MLLLALTVAGRPSDCEPAPAPPSADRGAAPRRAAQEGTAMLEVERLGGFAGFGGGALRSRGSCDAAELSPGDRAAVERFFAAGTEALRGKGTPPGAADMF